MTMEEKVKKELKLNPSSLPYVSQCPCWVRKPTPPNDAMLRGTKLDTAFRAYVSNALNDSNEKFAALSVKDKSAVSWAANAFMSTVAVEDKWHVEKSECKFKYYLDDVLISGEMDAWWEDGVTVFDLKSGRERDYSTSMDAYAYYVMKHTNCTVAASALLYCDLKIKPMRGHFLAETEDRLAAIVAAYKNPNKTPITSKACETCKYKSEAGSCVYEIPGTEK